MLFCRLWLRDFFILKLKRIRNVWNYYHKILIIIKQQSLTSSRASLSDSGLGKFGQNLKFQKHTMLVSDVCERTMNGGYFIQRSLGHIVVFISNLWHCHHNILITASPSSQATLSDSVLGKFGQYLGRVCSQSQR